VTASRLYLQTPGAPDWPRMPRTMSADFLRARDRGMCGYIEARKFTMPVTLAISPRKFSTITLWELQIVRNATI